MNTIFLLMAEFGTGDIPLTIVAEKYLGLDRREAYNRATRQTLPFPVYRIGSQKSPWLVRATDLASFLDTARQAAVKDWEQIKTPSRALRAG